MDTADLTEQPTSVYVVSLVRSAERRLSVDQQLRRLGVNYRFIDAVDAGETDSAWLASHVNSKVVQARLGRPMSGPEIACVMSHRLVYKDIVGRGLEGGLVLEDDVVLTHGFRTALGYFARCGPALAEQMAVFHLHAYSTWSGYLVLRRANPTIAGPDLTFLELVPTWSGEPWRTCGYYVTRLAARSLLDQNLVETVADHWTHWAKRAGGRILIAVPAPVLHPIDSTHSSIENMRRSLTVPSQGSLVERAIPIARQVWRLLRARVIRHIVRPVAQWFY